MGSMVRGGERVPVEPSSESSSHSWSLVYFFSCTMAIGIQLSHIEPKLRALRATVVPKALFLAENLAGGGCGLRACN